MPDLTLEQRAEMLAGAILQKRHLHLAADYSAQTTAGGRYMKGAWKPDLEPRWPKGTPGVDHQGHPLGGEFMQVADILSTIDRSVSKSQNLTWLAKGSTRIKSITAVRDGEQLRLDITLKDGRQGTLHAVPEAPFAKVMGRLVQIDSGQRVADAVPHTAAPHERPRPSAEPDLTVPEDVTPVSVSELPIPPGTIVTVEKYENDKRNTWPPEKGEKARRLLGPFQHTLDMWANSKGEFDPKRQKLHEKIIEQLLEGYEGGEDEPTVMFMAGGPGSAKTKALAKVDDMPPNTLHLDNDIIKQMLPEYKALVKARDDYAAYAAHDEAAIIMQEVIQRAMARGVHLRIDGTGNDEPGRFEKRMKLFADAKYKVRVTLFDVPTDVGIERTILRALGAKTEDSGRWISPSYTRDTYEKVARVFLGWKGKSYIADWRMYSTLTPLPSNPPILIADSSGIKNRLLYDVFVQKAGGNHGR